MSDSFWFRKPLPKMPDKYSSIIGYRVGQTEIYQGENGMLFVRNAIGHCREITMGQWFDLLRQGEMCDCRECFACGIVEVTEMMIHDAEMDMLMKMAEERRRNG